MNDSSTSRPKGLHIGLWVVQLLLGALFCMTGLTKTLSPIADLAADMQWTTVVPPVVVRIVGVSEFLGAMGLILPSVTRFQPKLTPFAAAGLTTVMLLATAFHVVRAEWMLGSVTIVIGSMAGFVAWGRAKRVPIDPR